MRLPTVSALLLLRQPSELALRSLRSPPVVAAANETLTSLSMGDVLAGSLKRQIREAPADEAAVRASFALDGLMAKTSTELDKLQEDLDRDLQRAAQNTSLSLRVALHRVDSTYDKILNHTAAKIDEALAPSRAATRSELDAMLRARDARHEARLREISRLGGVGRAATWRDEAALQRFQSMPKHPVVRVCEASALTVSLLLMLAFGDFVGGHHQLTAPPRVANVVMQTPQRTGEYDSDVMDIDQLPAFLSEQRAAVFAALTETPSTEATEARPVEPAAAAWWRSMRWALAAYISSVGYILLRSGTEEWAALALGMLPSSDGDGGRKAELESGPVAAARTLWRAQRKYRYNWERDCWQEE